MNVTFQETAPATETTENIILNGQKIGTIKSAHYSGELTYHAAIPLNHPHLIAGLIQGHAPTKIQAIQNALISGRQEAATMLACIQDLEAELKKEESPC